MPTSFSGSDAPVVQFDPALEISPFTLFRRLQQEHPPLLVDIRKQSSSRTLQGARALPGEKWEPSPDLDVVFFDEDGSQAPKIAATFQQKGFPRVKALFGGLDLYEFSLDPEIIGHETFLIRTGQEPQSG